VAWSAGLFGNSAEVLSNTPDRPGLVVDLRCARPTGISRTVSTRPA
jgi:hypothetical protein